jgi:hypothetical protein
MVPAGPSPETVSLVLHRAMRDGVICCEVCGDAVYAERGLFWSLHHRRYRDGRPDSHLPPNLILVCGASNVDRCHGAIHDHKGDAMDAGHSITRHGDVDPATVPVLIDGGSRWVYLTVDGYSDNPPGDAA